MQSRYSGILLHISSLPSPYGIGDLGKAAYDFVDFLKKSGQSYWQILPTNPTGFGDSPYQAVSAFAGNPYFIDPDALVSAGWLKESELSGNWGANREKTDYAIQFEKKMALLRRAYDRFKRQVPEDFSAFWAAESAWLEDYCLFRAIKEDCGGKNWQQWPASLRNRDERALGKCREKLADAVNFHRFLQYCFFAQWQKLLDYAHEAGVKIIGDIPIYVPLDSVDVWASPLDFQLTATRRPVCVAGCPPDAFNPDGQYWGHPIYDWEKMERDGFSWWVRRVGMAARLYDVVRIDHFRGIESYWSIPARSKTARNGAWMPGPGMHLVETLKRSFPDTMFIAEDLGFLTEDVHALVRQSGFPGMKVLQFAFDSGDANMYLPHHYKENCFCYTGTHDNDTLCHWLETLPKETLTFLRHYLRAERGEDLQLPVIREALSSPARWCMVTMQDWLGLGGDARMNEPGKALASNWCWRMLPEALTEELAAQIRSMTEESGR